MAAGGGVMSYTWFKLHHDLPDDIKLRRFTPQEKWAWVVLLCLASKGKKRGEVSADDEDIADYCEFNCTQDWLYFRDKLIGKGMAEIGPDGTLLILHWEDRQHDKPSDKPEAVKERVRKHRAKKKAEKEARETPCNALHGSGNAKETQQTRSDQTRSDQTRSDFLSLEERGVTESESEEKESEKETGSKQPEPNPSFNTPVSDKERSQNSPAPTETPDWANVPPLPTVSFELAEPDPFLANARAHEAKQFLQPQPNQWNQDALSAWAELWRGAGRNPGGEECINLKSYIRKALSPRSPQHAQMLDELEAVQARMRPAGQGTGGMSVIDRMMSASGMLNTGAT
jgi:hypothetical protein